MKSLLNTRFARLSAASCLAMAVAACGSDNDDPAPVQSSSAMSSSTAAMSSADASSSMVASSSSAVMSSSSMASGSGIATSCDPNGAFIECLDFESVSPGATPNGFTLAGTGVVVVEGEGAYSGNLALKVTAVSGGSFFETSDVSGTHWGRLYYKNLSHPSPVTDWSHTTLVAAYDNASQTDFRLVDMVAAPNSDSNAGKYQHLYNIDNPSRIDLSLEGGYTHTYNSDWVCLEWQVDAVDQEYHVFFNGNELALSNVGNPSNATDLQGADNWNNDNVTHDFVPVPMTFDVLKIGIQNYQRHSYTFLLDDFALANTRLGCDISVAPTASSSAMSSSSMMSSSSVMSSSSEAASSSAPSGPTQAEIDARVAAGLALYEADNAAGNICTNCHGVDGTLANFDQITDTTRDYAGLVSILENGEGTLMPACKPAGNCAEQIADYIWVQFLGGTLTNDGGTR